MWDPLKAEPKSWLSPQNLAAALMSAAITLLVLWIIHGPIVISPNEYLFGSRGEAIRNYFVLSFHAESGGTLHEFGGMNYPFGEQIVYSEGQPSLSYPLRILSIFSPSFHQHAVAILNLFLLGGVVGSAALLLLILRRFGVGLALSIVSAVGLALLAPQGSRLPWMFPQAFSALLPIAIFLMIRIVDGGWTWWRVIQLMLANIFFLFLNPYPGVIAASFTSVTLAAALLLRAEGFPGWVSGGLKVLACTVFPVLVFFVYLRTTDHHSGRPELPDGFFDFTAEFSTIFGSFFSPLMPWIERWTGLSQQIAWKHYEGNGYLGVFCVAMLTLWFGSLLWAKVFRRSSSPNTSGQSDYRLIAALAIGALCLGIFAAGLPFRLMDDGERWLRMLGPLAQFRCPGRFIWPLFYVANIVAVVAASRIPRILSVAGLWRPVMSSLVIIGSGLMVYEGVAQHQWVAARGRGTVNGLNRQMVETRPALVHIKETIERVDRTNYQAILTLPLFHIGSELLVPPSSFSEDFLTDAFTLSKHLRLPLVSSMLGRISLDESLATFQLYSPPYVAKDLCGHFNSLPFLVLVNRDRTLNPDEERLARMARPLFVSDRFDVLELEVSQLCRFDQASVIGQVGDSLPSFEDRGGVFTDRQGAVFLDSFEGQPDREAMRGEGALSVPAGEVGWVFDTAGLEESLEIEQRHELTFWFFNRGHRLRADVFVESNPPGGQPETHSVPQVKQVFVHQGEWSLFSLPLTIVHSGQRIRVGLRSAVEGEDLVVDDVLLRAHDATVIWNIEQVDGHIEHLVWNNHTLDRK